MPIPLNAVRHDTLGWLSTEPQPPQSIQNGVTSLNEGQFGFEIDTGRSWVYYSGQWRRLPVPMADWQATGAPPATDLYLGGQPVSMLNRLPVESFGVVDRVAEVRDLLSGGARRPFSFSFTRTADANAYAVNDIIQTATSGAQMFSWPNVARYPGGGGVITGIELIGNQSAEVWQPRVHIFDQPRPTVTQDNAAFVHTFAPSFTPITEQSLAALTAYGSTAKAKLEGLTVPFQCRPDSRDLFFELTTLTAFTPVSAAQYLVKLYVILD